ncbi:MAG TPA: acyl-CoA dehydrogenase [Myxococcales bacterium]|jgi:hypothetical protein
MAAINRYRLSLRELQFVLFEQLKLNELLGKPPFDAWGEEEALSVLKQTARYAQEVLGPLSGSGDREGCRLEGGKVQAPKGFKDAWKGLYEAGFKTLGIPVDEGGQGAPRALSSVVEEILAGANTAFAMYPGLSAGAAETIAHFGTPEQKQRYLEPMYSGRFSGTMCLTEAEAGSDVGACRTRATKNPDGTYSISGGKMFITAGDHDLAENVVHLVLARVDGAPAGTKGLSLFIVPKIRVRADGSLGEPNDVQVARLEEKMGLHGSATCQLAFGDDGKCLGELVGTQENLGMPQMFKLMNFARLLVGLQGVAIASSAYLNALEYARERKQGPDFKRFKDPSAPKVTIVQHADVRRMLLDMKARVEGIRAMILTLAAHHDRALALAGQDDAKAAYHQGQVELLTPLVKSYSSDQAFQICATAIQVLGGAGYTADHPIDQYLRDSKVFSIYEGTNHIQAMDLVGRKLGLAGGAHLKSFLTDIATFVARHQNHPALGEAVGSLARAQEAVAGSAKTFLGWSQSPEKAELIPANANRFLDMMSELTVGWLLLDQAVIAGEAAAKLGAEHPDQAFYAGKKYAALYFARNVLPTVADKARLVAGEDRSAIEVPDAALG